MSVKIRLARFGKSHQITYRIVVQDTRSKRDGKFLEILGFYNPHVKPNINIDKDRFSHWINKGAKPTEAVEKMLNDKRLTTNAQKM